MNDPKALHDFIKELIQNQIYGIVYGALGGISCGIWPLVYGFRHRKLGRGIIGFTLAMWSGPQLGVILALPIAAAFFFWIKADVWRDRKSAQEPKVVVDI